MLGEVNAHAHKHKHKTDEQHFTRDGNGKKNRIQNEVRKVKQRERERKQQKSSRKKVIKNDVNTRTEWGNNSIRLCMPSLFRMHFLCSWKWSNKKWMMGYNFFLKNKLKNLIVWFHHDIFSLNLPQFLFCILIIMYSPCMDVPLIHWTRRKHSRVNPIYTKKMSCRQMANMNIWMNLNICIKSCLFECLCIRRNH